MLSVSDHSSMETTLSFTHSNNDKPNNFYLVEGRLVNWRTYKTYWKRKVKIHNRKIVYYGVYIYNKDHYIREIKKYNSA